MKISVFLVIALFAGCRDDRASVPRPHAYPRVIFPTGNDVQFADTDCPFTFTFSDYARVEKRTSFFGDVPATSCWFDLAVDQLNARIHFSYYPVSAEMDLDKLINDAFTIANKINQRSNYMDEIRVMNAQGVGGLVMEFQGPAASPMHFYLTDSTHHFVKASLYYEAAVRPDSLAPVNAFMKDGIAAMINSFDWR